MHIAKNMTRAYFSQLLHAVPTRSALFEKSTRVPFYWTFLPFFGYTTHMPIFSRISPDNLSVNA